jgi:hypothetical protein
MGDTRGRLGLANGKLCIFLTVLQIDFVSATVLAEKLS